MPHSSGGGSHGGGSHGGSHSSSYGRGSRHVRSTYFLGARRYVYYKDQKPVYVYADYDITKKPGKLRFLFAICYLPFLITIMLFFHETIAGPSKLTGEYEKEIIIDDQANVLQNTEELTKQLNAFYETTGIPPAIMTVHNEDWDSYTNLSGYAYDLYVNQFDDEKHWLIVYSEPEHPREDFVDWYFEGMQGDDTDAILTGSVTGKFTDLCQKYLTADSQYSIEGAFAQAFADITPGIMDRKLNFGKLFFGICVLFYILLHFYFMFLYTSKKQREYATAKLCPEETEKEAVCEYCGGSYVVGSATECPHCGAKIEPRSYSTRDGMGV